MRSRRAIRIRRIRSWLTGSAAIALIPWIVYLAVTLPQNYVAENWRVAWVGFDVLLWGFLIATAVLGVRRHHLLTLFAFTTGVLLIADAWFDITTASADDRPGAVLLAALGELPLAGILIGGTLRIAGLSQAHLPRTASLSGLFRFRRPRTARIGARRESVDVSASV